MAKYLTAVTLILLSSGRALGGFTDFEDLTDGTVFTAGQTINSKGVAFETLSSTVRVSDPGALSLAGGSGLELRLGTLSFVLPPDTRHFSMLFGAYDPNAAFVVNGITAPLAGDFDGLDGSILGGVEVSVTPSPTPPFGLPDAQGTLVLRGQINSLLLRGPESAIDNVRIAVPEPSSVAFFAAVCLWSSLIRLRARK